MNFLNVFLLNIPSNPFKQNDTRPIDHIEIALKFLDEKEPETSQAGGLQKDLRKVLNNLKDERSKTDRLYSRRDLQNKITIAI